MNNMKMGRLERTSKMTLLFGINSRIEGTYNRTYAWKHVFVFMEGIKSKCVQVSGAGITWYNQVPG